MKSAMEWPLGIASGDHPTDAGQCVPAGAVESTQIYGLWGTADLPTSTALIPKVVDLGEPRLRLIAAGRRENPPNRKCDGSSKRAKGPIDVKSTRHPTSPETWWMARHPDMILQFAHHLALRLGAAVVRARGVYERTATPTADSPDANLADEPRRLGPAVWMFPAAMRAGDLLP
jgi:hypothetical protein